jgi:23S rRNA-/tRNA-specific pseudouridylate synthase
MRGQQLVSLELWAALCLPKRVKVLKTFHNDSIIALEKPVGFLSHPNESKTSEISLINGKYNQNTECFETEGDSSISLQRTYLLHRLDKATSGVMLVARDEKIARAIKDSFRKRDMQKEYFALVFGGIIPKKKKQDCIIWEDLYDKSALQRSQGRAVLHLDRAPQTARTKMAVVMSMKSGNISLIQLCPLTGYMHQLRYQCSLHGLPILGDRVYGDFEVNRRLKTSRLFLHASRITSTVSIDGVNVEIDAVSDLPDDFFQFD